MALLESQKQDIQNNYYSNVEHLVTSGRLHDKFTILVTDEILDCHDAFLRPDQDLLRIYVFIYGGDANEQKGIPYRTLWHLHSINT